MYVLSINMYCTICLVECLAPANGKIQCQGSDQSHGFYQDNCTFFCNTDFELLGPNNGTCLANQSWSGGNPKCETGLFVIIYIQHNSYIYVNNTLATLHMQQHVCMHIFYFCMLYYIH